MELLDQIVAERACERLIVDYAALVDANDWAAVAALYTPDGRMSRPSTPDNFITGSAAILEAFHARPRRATRHICANIRVMLSDLHNATAQSHILLFTAADKPPLVGGYADVLVCDGGKWRFVERKGSLDFT